MLVRLLLLSTCLASSFRVGPPTPQRCAVRPAARHCIAPRMEEEAEVDKAELADEVVLDGLDRMQKSVSNMQEQLSTLRVGRASPSLLDRVKVDYYGAETPLNQLASVSAPTPTQLVVDVYDKGSIGDVEKALMMSDLGMTPNNDGKVIRLNVPQLTAERRKELAKTAKSLGEEGKVAIRNIRKGALDKIKKLTKDGLSEDQGKDRQDEVQSAVKKYESEVDSIIKAKEEEITTV